jgi:2-hydroxychromene-2-carboxylate isomerase
MPQTLNFYFDYLSPFAYFAWLRLQPFSSKHNLELVAHPVVFGKLLDHWGQLGPAEIVPKSQWAGRYSMRYAALNGFEYNPPEFHPFNPLPALRLSLSEVSGEDQFKVIQAIFDAGWTKGMDISDMDILVRILEDADLDGRELVRRLTDPVVKQALIDETSDAVSQGVFGVPTMIINDELFWGNDQFEHMELLVSGNDVLDYEKLAQFSDRTRKIDRKRVTN